MGPRSHFGAMLTAAPATPPAPSGPCPADPGSVYVGPVGRTDSTAEAEARGTLAPGGEPRIGDRRLTAGGGRPR